MFGKMAGGGGLANFSAKAALKAAITSSPKTFVLAALAARLEIGNEGGGSEEEFARRIDQRGGFRSDEARWISMVAGALARLDEHSPAAVRVLAAALGFTIERAPAPVPAPAPRGASRRDAPSNPPRMFRTTFGNETLVLIETAGGAKPRFVRPDQAHRAFGSPGARSPRRELRRRGQGMVGQDLRRRSRHRRSRHDVGRLACGEPLQLLSSPML